MLKVSKSQKHFFLKLHCQIFRSFVGHWGFKKNCFWDLLTFKIFIFYSGEVIENGWPLILTMIGSLEQDHSDILVRSAFQCLQLVFTDFLPAIPYRCYPICVETATKFGSQKAELNVSLAAIGLLWNLSDYFFQVMYFTI